MTNLLKILILTAFISGCSTTYIGEPLPLPAPLVDIKLPRGSLDCVSPEGKAALVKRDRAKDARIKTLRGTIESTHK